jgi:hypothetical protein
MHQVREQHFAPTIETLDNKTQIFIIESSEIPEMGNQLEVIAEDEEMNDSIANIETQKLETQEMSTAGVEVPDELNIFIHEHMNLPM